MIKGQADTFFRQLKHRYREVPNFGDVYNQALVIVEKVNLGVTIKNINIVLEDFVDRRDIDHEIKLYELVQGIFIITAFEGSEPYIRMLSRGQLTEKWPFLGSLVEQTGFQKVKFKINSIDVTVEPYNE